jgi:hypothetical protein
MSLSEFLAQLASNPFSITFAQTQSVIEAHYTFSPTEFRNGDTVNAQGQNNGSCKLFAFAQLQGLSVEATLACFGDYYRKDVLEHPEATDHANIRNFMRYGWEGIEFKAPALQALH